jgi:peptide deformylase
LEEKKIETPDLMATIVLDINFLRMVSKKTSKEEVEKRKIVPLIKYALNKGWVYGYGFAAIQVGIPLATALYWTPAKGHEHLPDDQKLDWHLLINPEIIKKSEQIIKPGEGCLSIPNKTFNTVRYNQIEFMNDGQMFSAEGVEAQIIQHEVDHINGILVCDREYNPSLTGRNDPCPCGSGKKFKKCCLGKEAN